MPPGDLAEWILDESGLKLEIARYVRSTSLLAFLDKTRTQELDTDTISAIISKHFTPSAFQRAFGGQFRSQVTPDRSEALVRWFRGPVAARLLALETEASRPEARERLVAFAGGLKAHPPSPPRLELIHRLFSATEASDLEVETTMSLVKSLAEALNPSLPPEKRFKRADLSRALENVKATYLGIMRNARIVQYLFTYEKLADQDLEQYVIFWESSGGAWLSSVRKSGYEAAARLISRGLASEIDRRARGAQ